MNIKTITCHDVCNAGASLQAYALQTYLENLGHNVEIINYKPSKKSKYIGEYSKRCGNNPILSLAYTVVKLPSRGWL